MKILANETKTRMDMNDMRVPPKYSHRPRSAVSDATEKHVNMAAVAIRAVTIILGLMAMAKSIKEPKPRPVNEIED